MDRLLCRIGLHDWRIVGIPAWVPGTTKHLAPCLCVRCAKYRVRSVDHLDQYLSQSDAGVIFERCVP